VGVDRQPNAAEGGLPQGSLRWDDGRSSRGRRGGRLYEAIRRNTDLLLVRGVGCAGDGGVQRRWTTNAGVDDVDVDDNDDVGDDDDAAVD
jgi:hypothetical protein